MNATDLFKWAPELMPERVRSLSLDEHARAVLRRLDSYGLEDAWKEIRKTHGVEMALVVGRSRSPHITRARFEVMALFHRAGWSPNAIGHLFGRDRSSVVWALHVVRESRVKELVAQWQPATLPLAKCMSAESRAFAMPVDSAAVCR